MTTGTGRTQARADSDEALIAERLETPLGTVESRLRLSFAHLPRTCADGELGAGVATELVDD